MSERTTIWYIPPPQEADTPPDITPAVDVPPPLNIIRPCTVKLPDETDKEADVKEVIVQLKADVDILRQQLQQAQGETDKLHSSNSSLSKSSTKITPLMSIKLS